MIKAIFEFISILDKLIPGRKARLRGRIKKLKEQYSAIQDDPYTYELELRLAAIAVKLSNTEQALQDSD